MSKNLFRQDINALRAISVLGVLLFHYSLSFIPGGYTGVDIFFVISGFLMTGIIYKGLEEKQEFSIINFYSRRAKRIVPPMLLVFSTILLIGYGVLLPKDYEITADNIVKSLLFISNIFYRANVGYFAAPPEDNLLLHTWSLSIEWQFYLIYPVLLVCTKKLLPNKDLKWTVLALFTLAFISYLVSQFYDLQHYYSSFLRSWQLLLGGVIYIFPLRREYSKSYAIIGLALTRVLRQQLKKPPCLMMYMDFFKIHLSPIG